VTVFEVIGTATAAGHVVVLCLAVLTRRAERRPRAITTTTATARRATYTERQAA
jgi:hypothetical protein